MSIMVGYPLNDAAALDAAIQAENERIWEDQQIVIPEIRELKKEELADAAASIKVGEDCFRHGLEFFSAGIDKIEGSVDAVKLAGLYDQISDLCFEINQIRKRWGF